MLPIQIFYSKARSSVLLNLGYTRKIMPQTATASIAPENVNLALVERIGKDTLIKLFADSESILEQLTVGISNLLFNFQSDE